jgi:hypothetical protein
MDVYPHMMLHNHLDIGNDALLSTLWPVDDPPIVCAHPRDATSPSVSHDYKCAIAGMMPKECLGILLGAADSYIEPLHLCTVPCVSPAPFCPSRTDQCSAVTLVSARLRIVLTYGTNSTALFTA